MLLCKMRPKSTIHHASKLLLCSLLPAVVNASRSQTRLHSGWKFWHFPETPDGVTYSIRPDNENEDLVELRDWILPGANPFIADPAKHYKEPDSPPDIDIPYVDNDFDDANWTSVTVPHDWAIGEDFVSDDEVSGDMGRLPVRGVGWYRYNDLYFPASDKNGNHSIFLDVEGIMAYSMVWLNGHLVGGWPYGYASYRLDLTPYVRYGEENVLAVRAENPQTRKFSRWYPGAGIYRDVWITKVAKTHVALYGTDISTRDVSRDRATVDLAVTVDNPNKWDADVRVVTNVHEYVSGRVGRRVAAFSNETLHLSPGKSSSINSSVTIKHPSLWGPPPTQTPNMYIAITQLYTRNQLLDQYSTPFGIRNLAYSPTYGLIVNNERIPIQGVNLHHDLGALGAAYNHRAATRQLEILRELGANAIRTAHNPPAPSLLALADEMGFLVLDEIFDVWEAAKADSDFSLIFTDWAEADLRSFIRRDRNHPSIVIWSVGNEVPEQVDNQTSAGKIMASLRSITHQEDASSIPPRPVTASLNLPVSNSTMASNMDAISLNYQGEGVRWGPAYTHLTGGSRTSPQYDTFHAAHPYAAPILGSEVAWSLSTRGSFFFPVSPYISAPVNDTNGGGNSSIYEVSAYEVYSSEAGSTPDRVFLTQDTHPFVAGGFVWAGFDYLGEPYPYEARSAYSGILDLAGFKKERFWVYQARWRGDLPMAKIVPHWNWPDRVGEVTPVHVFSSGDEAVLYINGIKQGATKRRGEGEYRFRWDEVVYQPGELRVVVYKDGKVWAEDVVVTTGEPAALRLSVDRSVIAADGEDLSFVTVEVVDSDGNVVPTADDEVQFSIASSSGAGVVVATDNGFPADLTSFASSSRKAFHGLALAIVRAEEGASGDFVVEASSDGLRAAEITITAR